IPKMPDVFSNVTVVTSCVDEMNDVDTAEPPKLITAPCRKYVPVTVNDTVAPVAPLLGETDEIVGAGLRTVSMAVLDAPPPGPGFTTTTDAEPAVVAAGITNDIVAKSENV